MRIYLTFFLLLELAVADLTASFTELSKFQTAFLSLYAREQAYQQFRAVILPLDYSHAKQSWSPCVGVLSYSLCQLLNCLLQ